MSHPAPADRDVRSLGRAGFVLGVALGGFFDGILLHQVLQWHHLLSLVPGEDLRRIETQILADGAFHVLMYLVALAGLWMLWRARSAMADEGSGRRLLVAALLGFGVWNVVDVVGFHWVLHIHRIRVDVPVGDRLGWDLLWLALFGAIPLVAAALLARGRRGGGRGPLAPAALGLLVVLGGGLSTRAPDGTARLVLFASGTDAAAAIEAVAAENGRLLWSADGARLISVELPPGSRGWGFYRRGALLVGGPGSPAACLSWSRPTGPVCGPPAPALASLPRPCILRPGGERMNSRRVALMLAASAVSTGPASASELIAYFDHGSAEITQSAWGRLQAAACYAAEAAAVQVVAHTDRSGTEAYNQALSERRAQAVADALGRLGFNRAFIRPVGRGETQPAAPTSDGVREPLNRRASININFAPGARAGLPAACSSDPLGSRR